LRISLLLSLLLLGLLCPQVLAWGTLGHQAAAQVAYERLSPKAKAVVDRYLDGTPFTTAAVYPDVYRSQGGDWSSNLHYVNLPRGATHYLPAYCGNPPVCVVSAISNYTGLAIQEGLRGPLCKFSYGDAPCPLSFLTHFVEDVHQPLHAGYIDDKDGNDVKVVFLGKSTNLHAIWDTDMLERFEPNQQWLEQVLKDNIAAKPERVKLWLSAMKPDEWAEESFQLVLSDVYNFSNQLGGAEIEITEQYYAQSMPIVVDRLSGAAVRLAGLIDTLFA